jgi:hypothetical protein
MSQNRELPLEPAASSKRFAGRRPEVAGQAGVGRPFGQPVSGYGARLRSTTDRLLAGMSWVSGGPKPCAAA